MNARYYSLALFALITATTSCGEKEKKGGENTSDPSESTAKSAHEEEKLSGESSRDISETDSEDDVFTDKSLGIRVKIDEIFTIIDAEASNFLSLKTKNDIVLNFTSFTPEEFGGKMLSIEEYTQAIHEKHSVGATVKDTIIQSRTKMEEHEPVPGRKIYLFEMMVTTPGRGIVEPIHSIILIEKQGDVIFQFNVWFRQRTLKTDIDMVLKQIFLGTSYFARDPKAK